jgi:hypothetical protein
MSTNPISDRLLQPTLANIHYQQSLAEEKNVDADSTEDIWWNHRSNPKTEILNKPNHKYDHVPSRLNETTAAFQHSKKQGESSSFIVINRHLIPCCRRAYRGATQRQITCQTNRRRQSFISTNDVAALLGLQAR